MKKNNITCINKELIKKKLFLKNEIKILIYKSIIQNKNTKPVLRGFIYYKLSRLIYKSAISKHKNICFNTGRYKGTFNYFRLSRHQLQSMLKINNLQNTKINSW